jgi:hypothetical protein
MIEPSRQQGTGARGLLFGLLAAPIAWATLHMFDYLWIETACQAGLLGGTLAGLGGVAWVVLAATLIALVVAVVAGILSFRRWRALRDAQAARDLDPVEARSSFLALSGVLVSALFALLIVMTGVPVLLVAPCLGA